MVQPNIMAQLWRHTVWIWIPLTELSSLVLLSHRLLSYTVATLTVPFPLGLLGFSELAHVASWNSSRHVVGMIHMRGPNRHLPRLSAACPSPASFLCLHRAVRRLIPFCWVLIPSLIRAFSLLGMQDTVRLTSCCSLKKLLVVWKAAPQMLCFFPVFVSCVSGHFLSLTILSWLWGLIDLFIFWGFHTWSLHLHHSCAPSDPSTTPN